MKKIKIRKSKRIKAGEFRRNNARTGHPAYITAVIKKKENIPTIAEFIGITESPETHNIENIQLKENPNPHRKSDPAFIKPNIEQVVLTNKTFGKKLEDWRFSPEDEALVKIIIKRKKD